MTKDVSNSFEFYFGELSDPRVERTKWYPLSEILFVVLFGDAMGTQKAIARQIHDKGGYYVLALKGNQGTLNEDVRLFLEAEFKKKSSTAIVDRYEEAEKGHGRIEMRKCIVSNQIDWLTQKEEWEGLQTLVKMLH